jgi:tRNA-splicing ligase RtcB
MPTKYENVLSWASDIEQGTLDQAAKAARLPFVQGHVALMPDAHIGKGATVGSVIPTKGAIIPAAIGVDIGCGMIAVETDRTANHLPDDLGALLSAIEQTVPAGVGQGHENGGGNSKRDRAWHRFTNKVPSPKMTEKQGNTAFKQFGSLGSGNHFVEVCLDERDHVWLVLHSGSRGIGNQLATEHIDGAKGLMKAHFITLEDPDLAYLVEGTPEFNDYITAMLWAQAYAMENRAQMVAAALPKLLEATGGGSVVQTINCHHNFTQREHHHGHNVWLTRKGAIQARTGDKGVIPGSMGTRSYIVSGLGNPSSYNSCSHGAGRRLSRGQARRELTVASFEEAMEGKTWQSGNAEKLLDEHPASYKDIDVVMADQADLVSIDHTLRQVLNYKGL